ncbi:MAG: hypothetical protein ACI9S8_003271 [Chlamydiales bacterium]|jgi:hypothetical protein
MKEIALPGFVQSCIDGMKAAPSRIVAFLVHPALITTTSVVGIVTAGVAFGGAYGSTEMAWLIVAGTGVYDVLAIGANAGMASVSLEHWKRVRKKINDKINPEQLENLKTALVNPDPLLGRVRWIPQSIHEANSPGICSDIGRAITLGKVGEQNSGILANVFGKIGDVMAPVSEATLLIPVPVQVKLFTQLFAPVANDMGEHLRQQHKDHVEEVENNLTHKWSRLAVGAGFLASGVSIGIGLKGEILTIPLATYSLASEVYEWQINSHEHESLRQRFNHFLEQPNSIKAKSVAEHVYSIAAALTTAGVAMALKMEEEDHNPILGKVLGSVAIAASLAKVSLVWAADRSLKNQIMGELSTNLGISTDDMEKRELELYSRVMDWNGVASVYGRSDIEMGQLRPSTPVVSPSEFVEIVIDDTNDVSATIGTYGEFSSPHPVRPFG